MGHKFISSCRDVANRELGAKIRMARTLRDMSQAALGAALGVPSEQVACLESGKVHIGPSELIDLAEALNTTLSFFFQGWSTKSINESDLRASAVWHGRLVGDAAPQRLREIDADRETPGFGAVYRLQ